MRKNNITPGEKGLWRFSLKIYRQQGVPAACLALQDRHGIDVNLLLFAAYAATSGRGSVGAAVLAAAEAAMADWRKAAILPLRDLRRHLKPVSGAGPTRALVQAAELAAERRAQALLARHLAEPEPRPAWQRMADLDRALVTVAGMAAPALGPKGRRALGVIRRACEAMAPQPTRRRRPEPGPLVSPQRRTKPASSPNRSSARPTE